MTGAGWAWLVSNAVYFFAWVPLVHEKFIPGMHWNWMADILKPAALPFLAALLISILYPWGEARLRLIAELIVLGGILGLMAYAQTRRFGLAQ